jgi:hypothetical protein
MDISIINSDSNEAINKGSELLEKNDFFKELSEIMEDEKFNRFFNKWFTTLSEIKITVIYMKLYNEFKKRWKSLTDKELDKKVNTFIIWKMMRDSSINKFTISTVLSSLENKNIDIFSELQQFMQLHESKTIK